LEEFSTVDRKKICASALAESSSAFANAAKKNAALNESAAR
jgi:hypothetical protein